MKETQCTDLGEERKKEREREREEKRREEKRERATLRQEKLGFYIKRSQPAQCKHISPMTEGTLFFYCQALMPQYTVAAQ